MNTIDVLRKDIERLDQLEDEWLENLDITSYNSMNVFKFLAVGRIRELKGDIAEAEIAYYKSIVLYYGIPDNWLEFGKFMYRHKKTFLAQEALKTALALNPNLTEAVYILQKLQYEHDNLENLAKRMNEKYAIHMTDETYNDLEELRDLAFLKAEDGLLQKANELKEKYPNYPEIDYIVAKYYYNIVDLATTRKYIDLVLEKDPWNSSALAASGYLYSRNNDLEKAYTEEIKSLHGNNQNLQPITLISQIRTKINKQDIFTAMLENILKDHPYDGGALLVSVTNNLLNLKPEIEEIIYQQFRKLLYYNPLFYYAYQYYNDAMYGTDPLHKLMNFFYLFIIETAMKDLLVKPECFLVEQFKIWSYFKDWQVYCKDCRLPLKSEEISELEEHVCIEDQEELQAFKKLIRTFSYELYPSEQYIDYLPGFGIKDGHVQYLSFAYAKITNFPTELLALRHLRVVSFFKTRLQSLPKDISELQDLEMLSISGTRINTVPESLKELTKLQEIRTAMTGLKEETVKESVPAGCKITNMR